MSRTLAIIPHLVRMHVRTRLEYRGDMMLGWLSQIAS
jgi:ABC-2 type transport system permease protein